MAQPTTTTSQRKPVIRVEPNPRRPDLYFISTDAACNSSTGNAGFGWIVDDLASTSQHAASMTFVSPPLMAETLAVLKAMTFALSSGLEHISILSDSQILIKTINKREMKTEIFGAISDLYFLSNAFKSVSFHFISRSENVRADELAKQALWALDQP